MMKVFVIPSWFPSKTKPHYGIFIKEQLEFLAKERPDWQIGVSTWGQGDSRKLLWAKDHFFNLKKILNNIRDKPSINQVSSNLTHYYQPALSWTKKIKRGNLANLIKSSKKNFDKSIAQYGAPDILWVQASFPGALIGNHLSLKYQIPYVVHVRFGGFMFENLLRDVGKMRGEFLRSINDANKVTTTSKSQFESLKHYIPEATVIPNPVNTDFLPVTENQGEGILAIGRFELEKGFDILIDSMKDVGSTLTIVGNGSLLKKLQAQVAEMRIENKISFVGELDRMQVKKLIHNCSFLVLPSTYETFGNVLLEALSCGKPVVATKCGGPEEIVSVNLGLLCEPNSKDLAEKINLMIKNRSAFDPKTIRNEVEERFSPHAWTEKIEELFKSVVKV